MTEETSQRTGIVEELIKFADEVDGDFEDGAECAALLRRAAETLKGAFGGLASATSELAVGSMAGGWAPDLEKARQPALALRARAERAEAEVERLKRLIERDRTGLGAALVQIQKVAEGYGWIAAGEWGSYHCDDQTENTLRREVGDCLDAIRRTAGDALNASGARVRDAFYPTMADKEHEEEADDRNRLRARVAELEAEVKSLDNHRVEAALLTERDAHAVTKAAVASLKEERDELERRIARQEPCGPGRLRVTGRGDPAGSARG